MAELDKIINGLEHCVKGYCIDCPYDDKCKAVGGIYNLASDALELLKKQKPMEARCELIPKKNGGYGRDGVEMKWAYYCFTCGKRLDGKKNYCSYCGQAVKWE